jgi:HTH-type transcriptional regulator/antitoxin MqsA
MNTPLQTYDDICPACGEGHLTQQTQQNAVAHAGHHGSIAMQFSVCDQCGSELADSAQALANKRAMQAFKKQAEGLLCGAEIRVYRKSLKLKQETAAALFGGGKVAFSRYESDDISQSSAMDSLLRLCMAAPANLLKLASLKGLQLPAETRNIVNNHSRDQFIKLAPLVQKLLDQELANNRKHNAPSASNDSLRGAYSQAGMTFETVRWERAA